VSYKTHFETVYDYTIKAMVTNNSGYTINR